MGGYGLSTIHKGVVAFVTFERYMTSGEYKYHRNCVFLSRSKIEKKKRTVEGKMVVIDPKLVSAERKDR